MGIEHIFRSGFHSLIWQTDARGSAYIMYTNFAHIAAPRLALSILRHILRHA